MNLDGEADREARVLECVHARVGGLVPFCATPPGQVRLSKGDFGQIASCSASLQP
jgi:hypothetical protein